MSTNKRQRICQCCGMPLEDGILGRNEDGTLSEDYCQWCYVDGKYTYTDMDKMIDICVVHIVNESFTEDQARAYLKQLLPTLDYWKNKKVGDHKYVKSVDLIIFAGQSNMSGRGEASEAPECGTGYEYKTISEPERLVPIREPFGLGEDKTGGLDDRYEGGTKRSGSMVSAFVNEYYRVCARQIVAVSASKGGTNTIEWLDGLINDAVDRLDRAKEFLTEKGIAIDNIFVIWCQGESDGDIEQTEEGYIKSTRRLFDMFKAHGAQKCFMVQIGHYNYIKYPDTANRDKYYKTIRIAQRKLCETDDDFILAASLEPHINEMKDRFHYHQSAYNAVGKAAGCKAGEYILNAYREDA